MYGVTKLTIYKTLSSLTVLTRGYVTQVQRLLEGHAAQEHETSEIIVTDQNTGNRLIQLFEGKQWPFPLRRFRNTDELSSNVPASLVSRVGELTAAKTSRPTLFLIPGANGDVPSLKSLRADWSDMVNCVLLDYPDWPHFIEPNFSMSDLVEDFAKRIRGHAFSGPLLLAGYSLGGIVGWALAKRLADSGQLIDILFILDSDISRPLPVIQAKQPAKRVFRRLRTFVTRLASQGSLRVLGNFVACRIAHRPALLRLIARFRRLHLPSTLRYWFRFELCWMLYIRMVQLWQMDSGLILRTRYNGKTILVRAAEQEHTSTPDLGWQAYCTEFQIIDVEGDHYSMLNKRGFQSLYELIPETVSHLLRQQKGSQVENPIEPGVGAMDMELAG